MLTIASKESIKRTARVNAMTAARVWDFSDAVDQRREDVKQVCMLARVKYPESKIAGAVAVYPEMLKTQAPEWWGRQLKKADLQQVEAAELRAGNVRLYCSDTVLNARKQHLKESRELMERMLAVCELPDGTRAERELIELINASPSNPAIQRAELMATVRGTENYANKKNHKAMFITMTCPSRFHRNSGSRWDGSTPKQANDYLCHVWAKARAEIHRLKIKMYGLRIAEPHKDGCPHWHCLFWFETIKAAAKACRVIRDYFLMDSATETGAQKRRVTLMRINPKKGSATGYIAKYLCKNIDGEYQSKGEAVRLDDMRRDPVTGELKKTDIITDEAAARVKAWACCWRIRQFQRIGLPAIGVYRELRRLRDEYTGTLKEVIEPLRAAADSSKWDLFMELSEGQKLKVWTETSADKLAKLKTADDEAIKECLNKWQEPKLREVKGVTVNEFSIKTRFLKWVLMLKKALADQDSKAQKKQEKTAFNEWLLRISHARREAQAWPQAMAAPPPWLLESCQ